MKSIAATASTTLLLVVLVAISGTPSANAWTLRRPFSRRAKAIKTPTSTKTSEMSSAVPTFVTDDASSQLNYRMGNYGVDEDISSLLVTPITTSPVTSAPTTATGTLPSSSAMAMPATVGGVTPREIDLPRHTLPKTVVRRKVFLLNTEMVLGRLAMITALMLMAGEFFTGLSIADQVSTLIQ